MSGIRVTRGFLALVLPEDRHITLLTKDEFRMIEIDLLPLKDVDCTFVELGVGGGSSDVSFIVVYWPGGDVFRKSLNLQPKQFHITLSSCDNHAIDKSFRSIHTFLHLNISQLEYITSTFDTESFPSDLLVMCYHNTDQASLQQRHFAAALKVIELASPATAEAFIKSEMSARPTWPSPFLFFGLSQLKKGNFKVAMICLMVAKSRGSDSVSSPVSRFIDEKLQECAMHTEWGGVFNDSEIFQWQETGLSNDLLKCEIPPPENIDMSMLQIDPREPLHIFYENNWNRLPRFFRWIVPGQLSAMSTPRNIDDIKILTFLRVDILLTLTEEAPLPKEWFSGTSIENVFMPITDYYAPSIAQVEMFLKLAESGKNILVHCRGGKGRTGAMLACYIAKYGFKKPRGCLPVFTADDAIQRLRYMRPTSVDTERQVEFVSRFVSSLWKKNDSIIAEPDATVPIIHGNFTRSPLIMLVGLQGSGKSTFAKRLAALEEYHIISQDEIGSRAGFDKELTRVEKGGLKCVIDKCNVTAEKRRAILRFFNGKIGLCVFFNFPQNLCIQRAQKRVDHPTLRETSAAAAISNFAKSLEPPTTDEGFSAVVTVTSIYAASALILRLIDSERVQKFPRTRHLQNLGAATRDDLVLTEAEANAFVKPSPCVTLLCEEKVDGANIGISIDPITLGFKVQNRSHYINDTTHVQFKKLSSWLSQHQADLFRILTDNDTLPHGQLILFGEWLAAKHSIHYTRLPDLFMAFDVYDVINGMYMSSMKRDALLHGSSIQLVRRLELTGSVTEIANQLRVGISSSFTDGRIEGVYFRRENAEWLLDRAKMVREDFIEGNDHWAKSGIVWNNVSL